MGGTWGSAGGGARGMHLHSAGRLAIVMKIRLTCAVTITINFIM